MVSGSVSPFRAPKNFGKGGLTPPFAAPGRIRPTAIVMRSATASRKSRQIQILMEKAFLHGGEEPDLDARHLGHSLILQASVQRAKTHPNNRESGTIISSRLAYSATNVINHRATVCKVPPALGHSVSLDLPSANPQRVKLYSAVAKEWTRTVAIGIRSLCYKERMTNIAAAHWV